MITFDDFKKLEIKIGKVISVEKVEDTDKLLKFVFDLGNEQRQIIAADVDGHPILLHPEKEILPGSLVR